MKPILLDFPFPIITPRLIIRPPQPGEGPILNQAILESFTELNKWMSWATAKPTVAESEEIVRKAAANWILKKDEDPNLMLFILDKKTNDLIGASGFHHVDWDIPAVETGYWVRTRYAKQGFITEAINALTQYAFKVMQVQRMRITCDPENIRSRKVAERLGYQLEATIKADRIRPVTVEVGDSLVYVRYDCLELPVLEIQY